MDGMNNLMNMLNNVESQLSQIKDKLSTMSNADNSIPVVEQSVPVTPTVAVQESQGNVPVEESITKTTVVQNDQSFNTVNTVDKTKRFKSPGSGSAYTYERLVKMVEEHIANGHKTRADGTLWEDVLTKLKDAKTDEDVQVIVDLLNMDSKGIRGGSRRRKARKSRMRRVSSRRSRTKRSR